MAQPYVGEIRMFAGNFAPAGWMFCEGQLLPISENETLFQLIGTTYMAATARAPSPCPICGDGSRSIKATDSSWRRPVEPRDHTDRAADTGARPSVVSCECDRQRSEPREQPAWGVLGNIDVPVCSRDDGDGAADGELRGWLATPHELPALPVRRLYHFVVRDLSVANLRGVSHGRSIRR
jgi:tail collar domain